MSKEAAASFDAVRAVKLDVLERLLWATDFGSGAAGVHPPTLPGARSAFRSPPFNSALCCPSDRLYRMLFPMSCRRPCSQAVCAHLTPLTRTESVQFAIITMCRDCAKGSYRAADAAEVHVRAIT